MFVKLTRELQPGVPAEAFTPLTKPGPVTTGPLARVTEAAAREHARSRAARDRGDA